MIAIWFYLTGGRIVTETDASVGARTVLLAAQVAGAVVAKPVSEGQLAEPGTVLLELDPAPYRIALETAKAQHSAALDQSRAARLVYEAKGDLRKQTEASLALARETFDRVSALEKSSTAPPAQLDSARRDLRVAEAAMAGAVADEKAALAQIGGSTDTPTEQVPSVRQAQLAIENAERNLALTRFAAPFRGIITGADSVQLGSLISVGQSALALVATDAPWITANLKETDLTYVKVGDPVTVAIDVYPSRTWQGRVQAIGPATSGTFALLPPQNATGNWVKVVQRVPVRVELQGNTSAPVLRAGLSATVAIDTGHRRTLGTLVRDLLKLVRG